MTEQSYVPIPLLEKSLFVTMREVHKSCPVEEIEEKGFIAPSNHPLEGTCFKCLIKLDMVNLNRRDIGEEPLPPVRVPPEDRIQLYYYRLQDGRLYATTFGIWNMN